MALAQKIPNPAPAPSATPNNRKLAKGELLFAEGENSRAMYLIKNGMIRLHKKKGDAVIELDTVHSGQIVGELAFLDGNPRSASGEALTDTEVVEISGPAFQDVLAKLPDWLKILLKTIVGRLRSSSTRIRQLEQTSTVYDFDRDGKRTSQYVYLSPSEVLKICAAILLVGSRNSKPGPGGKGFEIKIALLNRYANQIMQVPVAKITTMLDVLAQAGILKLADPTTDGPLLLQDSDLLEGLISYLNEENLVEPSKRHDISVRGFLIMSLIAKNLGRAVRAPDGSATVNLADIRKAEVRPDGKEAFRIEEFEELVKLGYTTNLNAKSSTEMLTNVNVDSFLKAYRFQRVVISIRAANEQKAAKGGR